ncbi:MAG: alpha/beta fold hydrolase [Janthinobacterium lividum]
MPTPPSWPDTTQIHYVRTGPRGGPPVVLLHAFGMDLTLWDAQIAVLGASYDTIALDLPGHGQSAPPAYPLSFASFTAPIAHLLHTLQTGPVHLVGISFGGMLAQTLASTQPALVRSLSLIGTAATFAEAGRAALRERAAFVRANGLAALAPLSLARWFTPDFSRRRPEVLDRVGKLLAQHEAAFHGDVWELIATLDTVAALAQCTLPAQVLVGEQDASTPLAAAQVLATALATTKLAVIPASAHFTNVDAPAETNALLLQFLAACAS